MRLFAIATLATVMLGLGTAFAIAAPADAPRVTSPDPQASQYVSVERALQRLELEAELEDFYAGLRAQAEGLDQAERRQLYLRSYSELARLILESDSYAGSGRTRGLAYLSDADVVLRRELGLGG